MSLCLFLKRGLALLLCAVAFVVAPPALLEAVPAPQRAAVPGLPALDAEGYLPEPGGEFVYKDYEAGYWLYLSNTLQVEITRFEDSKKPLVWYESILKCRGETRVDGILCNPKNPGVGQLMPDVIAQRGHYVFAVNDDFFGDRYYDKTTMGIVLRDGKVYSRKTYQNDAISVPNMETMALLPDGSIRVFKSKELTPEAYVGMEAQDVFSFGPVLIREGEVNPKLRKRYTRKEPRNAFGMVAPGHYVSLIVEGRHKASEGTGLEWMALRMQELGVTDALNLDGGQTVALVFMGEKLNTTGKYGRGEVVRRVSGMLVLGTSDQVVETTQRKK